MFHSMKKFAVGIAALGALALGASAVAGAATGSSTTSATQSNAPAWRTSSSPSRPQFNGPAPGSAAHEDSESAVTGANADKAAAAAVKAAGGGKATAVTSNYTHDGYEVAVSKANGSTVTVHVDSSFQADAGGPRGPDQHSSNGG